MTYRERRERRAERREEWADKRQKKSTDAFEHGDTLSKQIPLGQPILVGHHSEKHHRRHLRRVNTSLRKGVEHAEMAEHHSQAARTIQKQLDNSIYSDDVDATERLQEKLNGLEVQRDRIKKINAWFRKNAKAHGLTSLSLPWDDKSEETAGKVNSILLAAEKVFSFSNKEGKDLASAYSFNNRIGFPPYVLSNLSGNIKRTKDRLKGQRLN